MDDPTAQSYAQLQAIASLSNAYNSWATPNEIPDPSIPILRPTPAKTRRSMKILERKLTQPAITHQPYPRVPKTISGCEPYPREKIHQRVLAPSPRLNLKETSPEVQPIARRTRPHIQNTQPPIYLCTRAQLQQALRVTPSQSAQKYFPKALLALWSTPVIDLYMPVLNAETGETL